MSSSIIKVGVDIISILGIREVDNMISLQLRLSLAWTDPRLTMYDLKEDDDLNTLTREFKEQIWIPQARTKQHSSNSLF